MLSEVDNRILHCSVAWIVGHPAVITRSKQEIDAYSELSSRTLEANEERMKGH